MSRPNDLPRPDDPDETPTRVGGTAAGDGVADEMPTVPSMKKSGGPAAAPAAHATPVQKVNDPMIGKELGGCRITGLLGRGAMGAVYKARQIRLDRDVAVKVIRPEMMTDQRTLKRFEVEARTVGRFNSAHVVMVHDVGFEQNVHYLVMEFVQGKNLRDHVKLLAGGRLPAAEAIPLLRQACKGLEEAQRLGVIHRDIKPDNLMLTDRGVLKIADFGIAKPIQEDFSMTLTSELIGTPLYMSPEQCQGAADLDFRSDMYSLGATFYYLLTGEPPVRASSVYELIQTKTKLENLCLWKALAELDQNHPLSRVIERMTALDRDDRYESYEALLNDIVIVEAGGTVQRLAPKPEKKELPKLAVPVKKQRGAALLAVAALIVVAAGGVWWIGHDKAETGANTGVTGGGAATNAKRSPAVVRGLLEKLQVRLSNDGPSASLLDDVKVVTDAEGAEAVQRDALRTAVDQGLAVQQKLNKLPPPKDLPLPFHSLRAYLESVHTAMQIDGTPSPLLQSWLATARSDKRAESTLGPRAQTQLLSAFTTWKEERARVGGDTTKLARLDDQLRTIEEGRRNLIELIPSTKAELDAGLSVKMLDDARRGLTSNDVAAVVDVTDSLNEIRSEFAAMGPNQDLIKRAGELRPSRPEQVTESKALLNELGQARERQVNAEDIAANNRVKSPRVPFDDVDEFWSRIDLAVQPLQDAKGELPSWAQALRVKLRDEAVLQGKVVAACRESFARWQSAVQANADAEQAASQLALLKSGKDRAIQWFPAAKEELERVVPTAEIDKANAQLAASGQRVRWLASTKSLQQRIEQVKSIAEWRENQQIAADLDAATKAAEAFATDPDVQRAQKSLNDARARWTKAEAKLADVAAKIDGLDLGAADSLARGSGIETEGKEELRVLGETVAKCREAFRMLEQDLDVGKTLSLLREGDATVRPIASLVPKANERIQNWVAGVEALQRATAGMIAIPAGTARGNRVESFFLSCSEVSRAEFAQFLQELRAALSGKDGAARLAAVAPRLQGTGVDETALEEILSLDQRAEPAKLPAERLPYQAAAAFAAWRGLVLPTHDEWLLAAFGDDQNAKPFSWGAKWTDDLASRNSDTNGPAAVDEGGASWRSPRLHHLSGNMAEWLQAEPNSSRGKLAGGRYSERSRTTAEEHAKGELLDAPKNDIVKGYGARTLLRPKTFAAIAWPK